MKLNNISNFFLSAQLLILILNLELKLLFFFLILFDPNNIKFVNFINF